MMGPMTDAPANTALIVPLTQPTPEAMRAGMDAATQAGADMVECRLDYLQRPDRAALRLLLEGRPLPVIATCRPTRQGGRFEGSETDRLGILSAAAELKADYVDVEDDCDPARLPRARTILSHHDFSARPGNLEAIVRRLAESDAAVGKIAFAAAGPDDALAALDILRSAGRPMIVLAMGEGGLASRVLARKFGAFGTFASLEEGAESAPGQLTVAEMKCLYRWHSIGAATAVHGVVGCPVAHSMSPAIHNAAFAEAGIDAVYVPMLTEPGPESFNRLFDALAGAAWLDFRGLSVTIPHKQNALVRVGGENVDELSRRIGAINTVLFGGDGSPRGWNTDYAAAIDALAAGMGIAREGLAGRAVAVIGAGGASRAIVAALAQYGAEVTIYNRTFPRAEALAGEFGARARPLEAVGELAAEIVINCTSVGMHPKADETPVPPEALAGAAVVFDTVYNPIETRLLREAGAAGCTTVSGVDMFVNQAVEQFGIWTGQPAPRQLMRSIVVEQLSRET